MNEGCAKRKPGEPEGSMCRVTQHRMSPRAINELDKVDVEAELEVGVIGPGLADAVAGGVAVIVKLTPAHAGADVGLKDDHIVAE